MNQTTRTTLHAGKFLALVKEGHWEYAGPGQRIRRRHHCRCDRTEQKLLLVEQYRIPVHARTIELPAGIIGDEPGSTNESMPKLPAANCWKKPAIPPSRSSR